MALGVYITYTILDFPDLSVDSTFPMGAAVTATLILAGMPPVLTLFIAFGAGALAGTVTGLIHVKLKVRDLLSGIIVMTALYSLNLRITGDKANLPIFSRDTIFDNEFGLSLIHISIENKGETVLIHGRGLRGLTAPKEILDCGNSGTTTRLICGILAAQDFDVTLTGDESIRRRPMKRIMEPLSMMGAKIRSCLLYTSPPVPES